MTKDVFYYLAILLVSLFNTGCSFEEGTDKRGKEKKDSSMATDNREQLPGCYQMTIGRDTAFLQLNYKDISVTGTLFYQRFEKDKSNGTILGKIENGIIKTWFTFQSEGKISAREIYFKIINDKLAEGYGDVALKNDSVYFKYPTTLKYEVDHPYTRIGCK